MIQTAYVYQGPTGHRTTSFSVLDILDPNKFTSRRRQQHADHRGERELDAYGAEKRRGVTREACMEPSKEEYQSESSLGAAHFSIILISFINIFFHYIILLLFYYCSVISIFTMSVFFNVSLTKP